MQHASDKSIIISEILDSRTRNLVSVSKISDYVLSNELVSMALAMVAEDKQINRVLEEHFAEEVLCKMRHALNCALIVQKLAFSTIYVYRPHFPGNEDLRLVGLKRRQWKTSSKQHGKKLLCKGCARRPRKN